MAPDKKTNITVLQALGLTGAIGQAVSCGPCLNMAVCLSPIPEDTGDTGDTGEEEEVGDDTGESAGTAAAVALNPSAGGDPTVAVLERGVLPEDVAALLRARRDD